MNLLLEALGWVFAPDNWSGPGGIGWRLLQHVGVTAAVVATAAVIATPAGLLIGHTGRGRVLVPLMVGAARSLPTLGLLTLVGLWWGIGVAPPFLALLVLAIPPLLAATHAGVSAADPATVDAARAIGLSEWQVLWQVEVPMALPVIVEGLRSTILQVVATATLAAYTADVGLGRFLFAGLKTRDWAQMIGGALLVVALALALDLALSALHGSAVRRISHPTPTLKESSR